MAKARKLRSFRIKEELLDALDGLGIDKTALLEAAIAKAIEEKRCPYCQNRIDSENPAPSDDA